VNVRLEGLRKLYGDVVAVDSVDLESAAASFHVLWPVGLREDGDASLVAGFEQPTRARCSSAAAT
jgi:hypothetical protein